MKPLIRFSFVIVGIIFITASFLKAQDIINPGPNFWTSPEAGMHFGGNDLPPIPAGFFGPGSDPFEGQINLEGGALDPLPFPDYDVLIERTTTGNVPPPYPRWASIDVEIVELNLVSTEPITVTYYGGMTTEEWHVEVELSSIPSPIGYMDVIKENPTGGIFSYMPLKVQPLFKFTLATNPSEKRTFDTGLEGILPLEYYSGVNDYPWEHSPIGDDLNPTADYPLPMTTASTECTLELLPYLLRQDDFWVEVDYEGNAQGGGSGYNDGEWYYYPNTDWWNIWFYDHPYDPDREKGINISFTISGSGNAEIVFNWSTGDWSVQGVPGRPPLPEDVIDPVLEELYIVRSEPIFIGPVTGSTVVNQYFEIPEYNPEWISIDIRGMNFDITNGIIEHVCLQPESGGEDAEFGDAPEDALAYPSLGITGIFPTCMNVPVAGWIQHNDVSAWFGSQADFEPDGNAGACPVFNPNQYNLDECFGNGDAGLMIPESFTITGAVGSEAVVPCPGFIGMPLGYTCQQAEWGADIDIDIHNQIPSGEQAYVNLLVDWNQDGQWAGSSNCPGYAVPEHVLVDFPIPNPFDGPLSALMAAGSTIPIGPNPGYVWARFSITEMPVGDDWNGEGQFYYGETEDYLLLVEEQGELDWGDAPDSPYPTLGVNNGAHHVIIPQIYLGNSIDGEPDGQPDTPALGDDNDILYPPPNDDEDGVTFTSALIPGSTATIDVFASVTGMLNTWIDFNQNGSWAELNEHIFIDVVLNPGNNNLIFTVPAGAANGNTYARFRFSTAGGLPYYGLAPDGEVEDYQIYVGIQTGDIPIDPDPSHSLVQNEISMALIPGTQQGVPAVLLAAYNDHPYPGGPGLGVSYSTDGGATWNPQQLPYPPDPYGGGNFVDMFDPTATADANGNLYVAQISTDYDWTNGPASGLFVHKSIDGGVTWLPPVAVATDGPAVSNPDPNFRFNDRCQMTADINPASLYYNNIYIVEIKDRGWYMPLPYSDIYFSSSTDGGATWSVQVILNENIHNMGNMPVPAVAPDGTIYVCWMDYNVLTGGIGTIYLNVSTDGGVTWLPTDIFVTTVNLPPLRLNGGTDVLAKGAAVIEVSPTNPQEVYIVYAEASAASGDEGDIFFIRSTDGGQNWSAPLRVNDDATLNDQVMPWIDVKPNGTIDVTWYDRRNDPSDLDWDVYIAMSTDGGNSFTPNMQINDVSAPSPNTPSGIWMGEYLGLIVDNTHAYIAFTSSLYDINGDVFFDKIQNPEAEIDFGDAPDPTYPTLLANNGARHNIDGVTFLGALIDAEPDGLQDPNALGDDNNNLADEDGIVFNQIIQGSPAQITVTTSTAGYVQGWMDFNADGDWADPGEQIFTDAYIHFGYTVCLNYLVPVNANIGTTYARFRFSTVGGLSYTGLATDGEVEDYEVEIIQDPDIKWIQEPCVELPGLHCHDYVTTGYQFIVIADDWLCNGGLVTDLHWWGNYENNLTGSGINYFHLSIHTNDPTNCLPIDPEVWGVNIPLASVNETNTGLINNEGCFIYKYEYYLDIPFEQIEGNFYWLDICAYSNDPTDPAIWRWQESDRSNVPILCSAASKSQTTPWQSIVWNTPPPTRYSDMAFVITSVELEDMDYGDAPDPFWPTLLASDGARHQIEAGFFLGASVDVEPDGQPQGFALGDDNNGIDDEDGIAFTTALIPGQMASVNVTLTDPTGGGGFLDAWIDFDLSGVFDAAEHLCGGVSCPLNGGVNTIAFNVPVGSLVGPVTFARFRLSRNGGLSPTGLSPDGEVEDYRVFIVEPGESKMHYPQLPDLTDTGIDVDMFWVPLADDFLCTETGPISEIVMWGSFADDWLPDAGVGSLTFQVTIYSDNPAGTVQPWSMPKDTLWTDTIYPGEYTVQLVHQGPEWWYDPATYWWQPANHNLAYRYNFFFDDPFIQQLDSIYWLEIVDLPRDETRDYTFGWKTSTLETRWNDDACFNWIFPDPPPWWVPGWNALTYPSTDPIHPYNGTTLDFAFIIKGPSDIDFGDAPDPTYPTLLANNGARHNIDGVTFLGALIDAEPDGLQDPNALGDDNNNLADEDGIVFNQIIQGSPAQITVTTSTAGYVQGWMDFNADGDWADPGEQIFTDAYIHFGYTVCLNYLVPVNANIGTTYARFRFSTVGGLLYTGQAQDGEVEDYEVEITQDPDIKWIQEPCEELPGLHCHDFVTPPDIYDYIILADDWLCNDGLVTDLHWWGNYENNLTGSGINYFHLSIHTNDPTNCLPIDPEVWGVNIPLASVNETNTGLINNEGCFIYKYEYYLDIPFEQIEGNFYWLDICAYSNDPTDPAIWRWQESDRSNVPILCTAASKSQLTPWQSIVWNTPPPTRYSDMAFVITSVEAEDMDYGDAPDPTYPTLLANNGARHNIDGVTFLGALIDAEPNGLQDPNALGDDNNNLDDEDGVTFTSVLNIGQPATVDVIASAGGRLNAWMDFDANGSWGDPGEQIFTNEPLIAGTNNLIFNIPSTAVTGITFTRFRFNTTGGLSYTGMAPDGEVEDYEVELKSEEIFKWEQLPDLSFFGLDVDATNDMEEIQPPHILADDFECTMTGPITNIKIWGSWIYDYIPFGMDPEAVVFTLSIHKDIPADSSGTGYSMPGEVLWWRTFNPGEFTAELYADALQEGWYDPVSGFYLPLGDTQCWLYSFDIDTNHFIQTGTPELPVIYWLDVQAQPLDPEPDCRFGWKTSEMHWNDDGAWTVGIEPYEGMWFELIYPPGHELQGQSIDLAFRITGEEGGDLIDFGDADDPTYPTLLASNGARHNIDGVTFLGSLIDAEPDGLPDPNALGDDNNNLDDEDGVSVVFPLYVGGTGGFSIDASVDGILNAWIDYNGNGSWAEGDEHVFLDYSLSAGNNWLFFPVPANANVGTTYARFRFSSVGGLTYTGLAPDGEVEDHEVIIEGDLDFGDAKDPSYPTLMASDGARHLVDTLIYLGACIDAEPNGLPDPNALGDDNNNLDDEDGVILPSIIAYNQMNTVNVIASVNGYLNAWIDFNQNGNWGDAGEQIFTDQAVNAGSNVLVFNVPSSAILGTTYARFRFNTAGGLTYTGQADDGEVEDYEVEIKEVYKWLQEPDLSDMGMDVDATYDLQGFFPPLILADDFLCDITGPLTRIEIWGSWYHDHYPWFEDPGAVTFTLSIHKDIPADQSPTGYSMPGEVLWIGIYNPNEFMYEPYAMGLQEGWYNPALPLYEPFGDTECWKYIFDLMQAETFIQEGTPDEPIVYWLDVQAQPLDGDPECRFGWKTSPNHWNDDAVWTIGMEPYMGDWLELRYPDGHPLFTESIDLAFAIYGQEDPFILVDLTAFLEGPYNGSDMNTTLNAAGLIPFNQPYDSDPLAKWFYAGTESVSMIPSTDITDWVLVELRDAPTANLATGATIIDQRAAFVLKDASIIATDGSSPIKFYVTFANNPFVVVWHRNHLGVLSANPMNLVGLGLYSYDFTTPAGQAYLNGQKNLGGTIYGLYGGDSRPDGLIDANDKAVWTSQAGTTGYLESDYNMDTQVDNKDKNDVWVPNIGEGTKVPN